MYENTRKLVARAIDKSIDTRSVPAAGRETEIISKSLVTAATRPRRCQRMISSADDSGPGDLCARAVGVILKLVVIVPRHTVAAENRKRVNVV